MPRSRSRSPIKHLDSYKSKPVESKHYDSNSFKNSDNRSRKSPDILRSKIGSKSNKSLAEDDQDSRTIFVWQLSKKIRESDLREFFNKAGPLKDVRLIKDQRTDRPKGIAYVEFFSADSVPKAMTFVGSRLLGVPIQINHVVDKPDVSESTSSGMLDNEYIDRGGVGLGNTGRLALMAKLAEGTGMELPQNALDMMQNTFGAVKAKDHLQTYAVSDVVNMKSRHHGVSGATDCFVIGNMFDDVEEADEEFYRELREDVMEECGRHGRVSQVFVDTKHTGGNVYVRCFSMDEAIKCVNVMNKRYFSGRMLTATFVAASIFHQFYINCKS